MEDLHVSTGHGTLTPAISGGPELV